MVNQAPNFAEVADELYQVLPESQLAVVYLAGHASKEPAMVNAMVSATDDMFLQLTGNRFQVWMSCHTMAAYDRISNFILKGLIMTVKHCLTLILIVVLTACAPKYNYLNQSTPEPAYDHILVMVDYLHLVDDVGKLLDYPADLNQAQLVKLQNFIESTVRAKGFSGQLDFAVVSSGIGINPDMAFEHYVGGKKREELIYPPMHLEAPYHEALEYQLIQSFAHAQQIALTQVAKPTTSYFADLKMHTIRLTAPADWSWPDIETDDKVAIMHVRAVYPRVSFVKAMGVSLLSAGLSAGATGGGYVAVSTPMGVPHSTALLLDNQTGQVVWKNHSTGDMSRFGPQSKKKFFKDFPALK